MLTSIQATMSSLESWYFGAQYLSLLPRCLRLAPNVTIRHSKLAFGGVAYSFPSRIHTYTLSYPCRAHCLTPMFSNFYYNFCNCFVIKSLSSPWIPKALSACSNVKCVFVIRFCTEIIFSFTAYSFA